MPEKRSYLRFALKGDITLHPEDNPSRIIKGDLVNICFLGFAANLKVNIGTGMTVQFEITTSLLKVPLTGKGKIQYIKRITVDNTPLLRVGVTFIDINKDIIMRILNMIQHEISTQQRQKKKYY
jgi:hypothetical protein